LSLICSASSRKEPKDVLAEKDGMIGPYHINQVWAVKAQFDCLDKHRNEILPFDVAIKNFPSLILVDGILNAISNNLTPSITFAQIIDATFHDATPAELSILMEGTSKSSFHITKAAVLDFRNKFDEKDQDCCGYIDLNDALSLCSLCFEKHFKVVDILSRQQPTLQPKTNILSKRVSLLTLYSYLFKFTVSKAHFEELVEWGYPSKVLNASQRDQIHELFDVYNSDAVTIQEMETCWYKMQFTSDRQVFLKSSFMKVMQEHNATVMTRLLFFQFYRSFTGFNAPKSELESNIYIDFHPP
jgi:hypothetical protein